MSFWRWSSQSTASPKPTPLSLQLRFTPTSKAEWAVRGRDNAWSSHLNRNSSRNTTSSTTSEYGRHSHSHMHTQLAQHRSLLQIQFPNPTPAPSPLASRSRFPEPSLPSAVALPPYVGSLPHHQHPATSSPRIHLNMRISASFLFFILCFILFSSPLFSLSLLQRTGLQQLISLTISAPVLPSPASLPPVPSRFQ